MSGAPLPEVRNSHLAGVLERKRAMKELERQRKLKEAKARALQEQLSLCPLLALVSKKNEGRREQADGQGETEMSSNVPQDEMTGYSGMLKPKSDWIPKAKKPTCVFALVSPALAQRWLEAMGPNRNLTQAVVDKYVRDRQAGDWGISSQGIGFDVNGIPFDLQHRMHMIVESGLPTPMLVVYGLDPKAKDWVDAHRRRTLAGQMQIDSVANATKVAAIARELWRIAYAFNGEPTTTEGKACAEKHKDAIEWVIGIQHHDSGTFDHLLSAPINAALCIAWERNKKLIAEFFDQVWDGNYPRESPQHAFVKYVRQLRADTPNQAKVDGAPARLSKILRTCYGYVHGEIELKTLREGEQVAKYYLSNRRALLP
jgi:hypothetical protein